MPDHGPIYLETIKYLQTGSTSWLVEPWNAATSFLFILLSLFWAYRMRGSLKKEPILLFGVVLILIGGIGGTLYHALRTERAYLFMDWMPIAILTLACVFWFLTRLTNKHWIAFALALLGFFIVRLCFRYFIDRGDLNIGITIGYSLMGLYVLAPIGIYLYKTKFKNGLLILIALVSFILAAFSRAYDVESTLPMGTHFLWHIFGAIAAFSLLEYIFRIVKTQKPEQSF